MASVSSVLDSLKFTSPDDRSTRFGLEFFLHSLHFTLRKVEVIDDPQLGVLEQYLWLTTFNTMRIVSFALMTSVISLES